MKNLLTKFKMFFILATDLAALFGALFLMIFIRYGKDYFFAQLNIHFVPFLIIIILYILTFYIFNLYSFRFNKNITEFTSSFIKSLIVSFFFSILIFYIFGSFFKLTPKTNLIIFTGIFGVIDFYSRIIIRRYFVKKGISLKIIAVNNGERNELIEEIINNQNIGYKIIKELNNFNQKEIFDLKPDIIILESIKEIDFDNIYSLLKKGIAIYTINNFYEETFQKVATEKIDKETMIDYVSKNKTIFNFIKRIIDVFLSLLLIIIFFPIFLIIAILIKITSKGPVMFSHKRISLNDNEFIIYKFRSMYLNSEKNGAVWTEDNKKDPRITPVGRFLRGTHLDEIPQLINILKGELSFVGPRPERPEFVDKLSKDILYYNLRHSVKAGLTGWAQVNYKYGASVEDAKEKLRYDFYYIKNRNIFFDILIILKTIAKIFTY
ncbi:exopolysaccharide biosynthesis polyprenyl glycosylphosphotransferase [Candidatus Nomurabacteria bacterium]|nr:exopolysaccharide biosynthesis polyprenyl glycosylphosphotransferase [Candidatus Nomurabacteria bacterium]